MRNIVETERYQRERAQITPNIQRWDEVFRGVEWGLANKPDKVGQPTHVDGIYAVPTDDWPGVPAVVIYYTFDEKTVTLHSMILAEIEPQNGT